MQRRSANFLNREELKSRAEQSQSVVGLPAINLTGREKQRSSKLPNQSLVKQQELRKYFYFDSEDEYIRRILLDNGWLQCRSEDIKQVRLVWVYNPDKFSSSYFEAADKVNHFRNSHVLTTKEGLRSTLYQHAPPEIRVTKFYPRTYDLHSELEEFEMDFNRTALLNLLRKYMVFIETANIPLSRHPEVRLRQLVERGWQGIVARQSQENFLFPRDILLHSLIWFQSLYDKMQVAESLDEHIEIPDSIEQELVEFSRIDPPYQLQLKEDPGQWVTPNDKCVKLIRQYASFFEQAMPQYRSDGFSNIWVVKPSQSSKGRNLHLIDNKQQLKRHTQSSRIVQKYIENIWVFTDRELLHYGGSRVKEELRRLLNKKFDIRIWVLVTSFQPLTVYFHQEAYLRLTSGSYSFNSLSNHYEHLTNYSINRLKSSEDDSFVLLSTLQEHLASVYGYTELRGNLQTLVVSTLKCAQYQIPSGNSFELYGFDVILDCDLNPWLLEVNMSPACRERGALKDLLKSMGEGLLSIVGAIPSSEKIRVHGWKLIHSEVCLPAERLREDIVIIGNGLTKGKYDMHEHYAKGLDALTRIQRFVKQNRKVTPIGAKQSKRPRVIHLISVIIKLTKLLQQRLAFRSITLQKRRKKHLRKVGKENTRIFLLPSKIR